MIWRGDLLRLLFEIDLQDYAGCTRTFTRNSARSIILSGGRVAMVHSLKYDYYKFPGGGIEAGESLAEALCREVREESGMMVDPDSIREFGLVHRRSREDDGGVFIQDNYYYLCDADENVGQELDEYEAEEGFTPEWVTPAHAIETNRYHDHGVSAQVMLEREALVLERLMKEGYFA